MRILKNIFNHSSAWQGDSLCTVYVEDTYYDEMTDNDGLEG